MLPTKGGVYRLRSEIRTHFIVRNKHLIPVYEGPYTLSEQAVYEGWSENLDCRCSACKRRIGKGCVFRDASNGHIDAFGRHCLRRHVFANPVGQEVDSHE